MNEHSMELKEKNGVKYYVFPSFEDTQIVSHMFTTRIGGISHMPFRSLNLGVNTMDKPEAIRHNFNKVLDIISSSVDRTVTSNQIHGVNIKVITEVDINSNKLDSLKEEGVDGLVTNVTNLTLATFYADCVPLFFLDPNKRVIGLAHSGWRGTVNKIGERMLEIMENIYGSKLEDVMVGIGPSIGPCCYEIDEYVYEKFNNNFTNTEHFMVEADSDKWYLNLWKANEIVVEQKGVLSTNIYMSNLCTSCNNDKFFSYRKELGKTGRMAAIIKLK